MPLLTDLALLLLRLPITVSMLSLLVRYLGGASVLLELLHCTFSRAGIPGSCCCW
jgi:hypothetical protein